MSQILKNLPVGSYAVIFPSISSGVDEEGPLEAWYFEVIRATWATPQELKAQFGSASILKNNRVVFNIAGNKYRLVVAIDYRRHACFVKFIGSHKQYDSIDAETYDGYSTHKK